MLKSNLTQDKLKHNTKDKNLTSITLEIYKNITQIKDETHNIKHPCTNLV